MIEVSEEYYRKLNITLDACCFRLGVSTPDDLYRTIHELDDAVKAIIYENNNIPLLEWWGKRKQ